MAGQCRRYFKGPQVARERIDELGRPLNIIHILGVYSPQPKAPWWTSAEATGGLVIGLNGPHVIDTIIWQSGRDQPGCMHNHNASIALGRRG